MKLESGYHVHGLNHLRQDAVSPCRLTFLFVANSLSLYPSWTAPIACPSQLVKAIFFLFISLVAAILNYFDVYNFIYFDAACF